MAKKECIHSPKKIACTTGQWEKKICTNQFFHPGSPSKVKFPWDGTPVHEWCRERKFQNKNSD